MKILYSMDITRGSVYFSERDRKELDNSEFHHYRYRPLSWLTISIIPDLRRQVFQEFMRKEIKLMGLTHYRNLLVEIDGESLEILERVLKINLNFKKAQECLLAYSKQEMTLGEVSDELSPIYLSATLAKH